MAGGQVLTGTMRREREARQVREQESARAEPGARQQQLIRGAAEAKMQVERLHNQPETMETEELLEQQQAAQEAHWKAMRRGIEQMRGMEGTEGDQGEAGQQSGGETQ